MKARSALLVVAAPVLVMAAWLLWLQTSFSQGTDVIFEVRGRDPRDLLRGHYIEYEVYYGERALRGLDFPPSPNESACMCLQSTSGLPIAQATRVPCSKRDPAACPLFLQGSSHYYGQFQAGIERYYIPEPPEPNLLQTIPEGTTITVRVAKNGAGYVTGMFVKGQPVLEYARSLAQVP